MQPQEFTDDEMLVVHDEGKQSFRTGLNADQCPYSDSRADRWKRGFLEAEASFLNVVQSRPRANAQTGQRGLISRLWRGEEGLGRTYWLYGVLYPFLASFAIQAFILVTGTDTPEIQAVVAYAALAYIIFISVAIWRSATANGPITGWGRLARFAVLGVPLIGLLAAILIPLWHDSTQTVAPTAESYSYPAPAAEPGFLADDDVAQAATYAINRYPFLNSESPAANLAAIDETIALRDRFIEDGYFQGTAIRMAAEITGSKYSQ